MKCRCCGMTDSYDLTFNEAEFFLNAKEIDGTIFCDCPSCERAKWI